MKLRYSLRFCLFVLPLLFLLLLLPIIVWAAIVDAYGGTYANWPDGNWVAVPGLEVDNTSDISNPDPSIRVDQVDIVGTAPYPAVYYAYDADYAYFRVRVDVDYVDTGSIYGTFNDTIAVIIDGGSDEGEPDGLFDYAIAWDTNGIPHEDHGLEMAIRPDGPMPSTWSAVQLDDVDGDETAKLPADIALTGGEGYVRLVDDQPGAGVWEPCTFVDMAVSWDYFASVSPTVTLAISQAWQIQVVTISDEADHTPINGDIAGLVSLGDNPATTMLGQVDMGYVEPEPPEPVWYYVYLPLLRLDAAE